MAKQVRIRRQTLGNLNTVVPASSEIHHDTTNDRLHIGNALDNGGVPLPNFRDIQNSSFIYAVAAGTANALTASLSKAPASLAAGQLIYIKASASNTGASTLAVNGLAAKNILKQSGGSLVALTAGDIINGCVYPMLYDGSQYQLLSAPQPIPAPQGMTLLDIQSAAGVGQLDLFNGVGSTYINYMLILSGIVLSSSSASLYLRLRQGGSVKTSSYRSYVRSYAGSGTAQDLSGSSVAMVMTSSLNSGSGSSYHGGKVDIQAIAGTFPTISGSISKIPTSGSSTLEGASFFGAYNGSSAQVDGIRLLPSTGSISSGSAFLYGLKSSL